MGWLLGVAVVGLMVAGGIGLARGEAASKPDDAWGWVPGALAELSASAIQSCTAQLAVTQAANAGQKDEREVRVRLIGLDYGRISDEYNLRLEAQLATGQRRPWDVPPVAPPMSVMQGRACIKLPAIVQAVRPQPPALEPGQRFLTLEQLDAAAAAAGWPNEPGWWPDMRLIIQCETGSLDMYAHNTSDPNGGSYGLAQLNGRQHFDRAGEDFEQRFDPVVNLRTALWLRTVRGHFGGEGGWKICSERYGIP